MIAFQLLAPGGKVVMVGDPQQLPPTVLSKAADSARLSQSLFQRLQEVFLPLIPLQLCNMMTLKHIPKPLEFALSSFRRCVRDY